MRASLKAWMKGDAPWIFLFCAALIGFYPELWLVKSAPLVSDHWEQHYPWAFTLHQFLQRGEFPFWTPLIQCGFPIASESQIGIFYIPNLVLSLLLPFHAAYSYTMGVHFLIAGLGTYVYSRCMGLGRPACFLAAFLFVFGTSYGGAYYNITSLKTLAWFPLLLWLWEKWLREVRIRWLFFLALGGAQCLVAGYLQVAALGLFIFGVYALGRLGVHVRNSRGGLKEILKLSAPAFFFAGVGVVLALPQILLTFQMAIQSNRTGTSEDYAYVGSLSPLALLTLLLPNLQGLFRGNCLYSGVFAFFCVLAALSRHRTRAGLALRVWICMGVFCLLLALGQWSPLYVGLIKLTHFYSFRTPSKFLIFFNFAWVMIAAIGFERLWQACGDSAGRAWVKKIATRFIAGLALILGMVLLIKGSLLWQREGLRFLGEWILRGTVYGHQGHPHSWQEYEMKLNDMLAFADQIFSFQYRWTVWTAVVLGLSFLWGVWLRQARSMKTALCAGLILLAGDLYGFSFADIRSDFLRYSQIGSRPGSVNILLQAREQKALGRVFGFRDGENVPSLIPSVNMLYGIEDIGAYSPLVSSRYYEAIGRLGNVNDSNAMLPVTRDYVLKRIDLLRGLDVSHIVSRTALEDTRLKLISPQNAEEKVYQLNLPHQRAYFPKQVEFLDNWDRVRGRLMAEGFDPQKKLLLERSAMNEGEVAEILHSGKVLSSAWGNGRLHFELETEGPAFFVVIQSDAPGWRFVLTGQPVRILKAYGLFQAFYLPRAGRYTLEGRYDVLTAMTGRGEVT